MVNNIFNSKLSIIVDYCQFIIVNYIDRLPYSAYFLNFSAFQDVNPGSTSASDQHCTDVVSRHTSMSGQCWQPTSFPYGSRSRSDIEAMSVNDIVPTLLRHLFYIFPTACRYSADINTMFFQCCPDTKYDTYPTPIRRCSYSLTTLRLQFGQPRARAFGLTRVWNH